MRSIRNKNNWNKASKRLFGSYSHSGIPRFPFRLFCSPEQNSRNIFRNIFLFRNIPNERALSYLKDTKFFLESKVSFIHISSIAPFKLFLIAWLWEYCTFSESSLVSLKSSSRPKYTQYYFPKKIMFYYQTFFLLKFVLYLTVLSKYLKKKSEVTVLV